MTNESKSHGGKRPGAGRPVRPTAKKKTILIEQETIDTLTVLGDGYLGHGIDKAAQMIKDIINSTKKKAK